jgi:hypothetical protein
MWRSSLLGASVALTLAALLLAAPAVRAADDVRVSVVAILATADGKKIDPEVEAIAAAVRKEYPSLTGFHLARMSCDTVALGSKETFQLEDDQVAVVGVKNGPDKNHPYRVEVEPPLLKAITYSTISGKYFPIVTPYHTKAKKEQLILAIMVTGNNAK